MTKPKTINVRMSTALHDQIGRVTDGINRLAESDPTRARLSRTEVMRMAIEIGIDVMERRLNQEG